MLPSEVLVAIISMAGSALGVIAGVIGSSKLTEYRLSNIESKVEELDKKIDAFTDISVKLAVIEQRLKDLEDK